MLGERELIFAIASNPKGQWEVWINSCVGSNMDVPPVWSLVNCELYIALKSTSICIITVFLFSEERCNSVAFSTMRRNIFQLHCISGNGINCNHWHQIFSSLGAGGEEGGVCTALKSPLPQGGYYNVILLCSE